MVKGGKAAGKDRELGSGKERGTDEEEEDKGGQAAEGGSTRRRSTRGKGCDDSKKKNIADCEEVSSSRGRGRPKKEKKDSEEDEEQDEEGGESEFISKLLQAQVSVFMCVRERVGVIIMIMCII
jgi:hypothetical protein